MAETVECVTNNTGHLINLAPIPGLAAFPSGIKLIPGLNRVPKKYMDAWRGRKVAVHDTDGAPVKVSREVKEDVVVTDDKGKNSVQKLTKIVLDPVYRYPGQDEIAKLGGKHVRIVRSAGKHIGPMLTFHEEGAISPNQPEGPEPPVDLPGNEVHAIKLVECTADRKVLQMWHDFDPRQAVKEACQRALNGGH